MKARKMMSQQQDRSPAEVFDSFFGPTLFSPWAEVLLDYAQPQPGERVLDLACGTGTVARKAAPLVGAAGTVVGADINPGMLEVARAYPDPEGVPIAWQAHDAASLDFPDDSFDLVLCQQGLQFFPNRWAALKEIQRVLAEGGRLMLNLWQSLERHAVYHALIQAEAQTLGVPREAVAGPFLFPDAEELRALLESAGYRGVQVWSETLDAVFPSTERFVELTLYATTAFLDTFDASDPELFTELSQEVSEAIAPVIDRHRHSPCEGCDEHLVFPMHWNIAMAYA
jgi:ubiquinone/menaquinone biosynthesis C-methylase UbiE